jgi:hypothetical protein
VHEGRHREAGERQQRWEADLGGARAEIDRLAALVQDRDADLATSLAAQDRLLAERESARVEVERIRMALYQLEGEQVDRGEQERTEIDRLQADNERLRLGHDRLLEENERLRNGRGGGAEPASSPDRDEELRKARARVESLEREVAEVRRLENEMREILAGIGIRFREV